MNIRSGAFGEATASCCYRAEWLGDVYVERVIWNATIPPQRIGDQVVAADGYVWFRFWLPNEGHVVERYYEPSGELVGTRVHVCMPPACDEHGCQATDLLMDLWIETDGRVTLFDEIGFEEAVRLGALSPDEAAYAEQNVRRLTAGIARGRFPPPIVRNWQMDPSRIQSIVRGTA